MATENTERGQACQRCGETIMMSMCTCPGVCEDVYFVREAAARVLPELISLMGHSSAFFNEVTGAAMKESKSPGAIVASSACDYAEILLAELQSREAKRKESDSATK